MRNSDLAIIFFSLLLIFVSLIMFSSSLSDRRALLDSYRLEYSGLCSSPLFSPLISFSGFVAVHEDDSLNLSVVEWYWVYSCVSYDVQVVRDGQVVR